MKTKKINKSMKNQTLPELKVTLFFRMRKIIQLKVIYSKIFQRKEDRLPKLIVKINHCLRKKMM